MNHRIVILSDTHRCHWQVPVPPGDVLIHAGDFTEDGSLSEVADFDRWLAGLPHPYKVVIAGNHESCFEQLPAESRARLKHAIYLQDSLAIVDGLRIYGSPWQPAFANLAFNLPRGELLKHKWDAIPSGVDILVTHTPPYGLGDRTYHNGSLGCEDLRQAVDRLRPRLHAFGHIHVAHGLVPLAEGNGYTQFVNASVCNAYLQPVHPPLVIDLPRRGPHARLRT